MLSTQSTSGVWVVGAFWDGGYQCYGVEKEQDGGREDVFLCSGHSGLNLGES